jgi:hypothetical protein
MHAAFGIGEQQNLITGSKEYKGMYVQGSTQGDMDLADEHTMLSCITVSTSTEAL